MATKQDYDNTMALWAQVRETTETSAASHHLRFFHEVVEPTAKQKPTFTVKDLTDAWNAKFSDRKSSDTIRNYVDFLCLICYMSKIPDPEDKRQKLLEVIQEQSGIYTVSGLSVFFTLESLARAVFTHSDTTKPQWNTTKRRTFSTLCRSWGTEASTTR